MSFFLFQVLPIRHPSAATTCVQYVLPHQLTVPLIAAMRLVDPSCLLKLMAGAGDDVVQSLFPTFTYSLTARATPLSPP